MDKEELKQCLLENLSIELKVEYYEYAGSKNELIIKFDGDEICKCNLHELSID